MVTLLHKATLKTKRHNNNNYYYYYTTIQVSLPKPTPTVKNWKILLEQSFTARPHAVADGNQRI